MEADRRRFRQAAAAAGEARSRRRAPPPAAAGPPAPLPRRTREDDQVGDAAPRPAEGLLHVLARRAVLLDPLVRLDGEVAGGAPLLELRGGGGAEARAEAARREARAAHRGAARADRGPRLRARAPRGSAGGGRRGRAGA